MYEQTLVKTVEPIKKTTISRMNKGKKWKYGYNKEQDIIVQQEQENNKCCTIAMRQKGDASGTSHTATAGANAVLDSWGFFLE